MHVQCPFPDSHGGQLLIQQVSSQITQNGAPSSLQLHRAGQARGRRAPGTVVAGCWKLHECKLDDVMATVTFIPIHWCPAGLPLRSDVSTGGGHRQPEQGSCHTTEVDTTVCPALPALGEPGLWSQVPQAQPAVKLGLAPCAVQRGSSLHFLRQS